MKVFLILRVNSNTYIQCPLQFSSWCREAIQHMVLSHTENPLPSWWHNTCHKVTSFTLTRRQWTYCLTLKKQTKFTQTETESNLYIFFLKDHDSQLLKISPFSLFIYISNSPACSLWWLCWSGCRQQYDLGSWEGCALNILGDQQR